MYMYIASCVPSKTNAPFRAIPFHFHAWRVQAPPPRPRSKVLELCGEPGPRLTYIFNGDFVDRGEFRFTSWHSKRDLICFFDALSASCKLTEGLLSLAVLSESGRVLFRVFVCLQTPPTPQASTAQRSANSNFSPPHPPVQLSPGNGSAAISWPSPKWQATTPRGSDCHLPPPRT